MASADLFIRAGDTTPVFQDTILDQTGNVLSLTGATVTFVMRSLQSAAAVPLAGTVSVVGNFVQYAWAASDTATPGLYSAEWHVVLAGGGTYTFPNNGYRAISIEQPLGTAPQQLVSVADAREYLNFPNTDTREDAKLARFIAGIRPVVENITGPIIPTIYEEWHDGGQYFVQVRRRPSTTYGTTPLLDLIGCDEYRGPTKYSLAIVADPAAAGIYSVHMDRLGRITRRTTGGGVVAFPHMPESVHVWYRAGQQTVPANVYEGTLELIRINYQRTQQSARGVVPAGGNRDDEAEMGAPGVPMGFLVPGRVREMLSPSKRPPSVA